MKPAAGELTNLDIASKLGCLDSAELMHHGRAQTIKRGPYKGDELSVYHIIPAPWLQELDNVIANLELMPLRMNESKTRMWASANFRLPRNSTLLSREGLRRVIHAATRL